MRHSEQRCQPRHVNPRMQVKMSMLGHYAEGVTMEQVNCYSKFHLEI